MRLNVTYVVLTLQDGHAVALHSMPWVVGNELEPHVKAAHAVPYSSVRYAVYMSLVCITTACHGDSFGNRHY